VPAGLLFRLAAYHAGSGTPLSLEIPGAALCAYCAAGPAWLVPLMFLSSSCARAARALSSFIVSRKTARGNERTAENHPGNARR
jgi:hypothetical protein